MSNENRRQSRRFEPADGRDSALLTHKRHKNVAAIVDVSAGGFRICLDTVVGVEVGDVVGLDTHDGHHVVRITNARIEGGKLYLGLERIQDLPPESPEKTARSRDRHALRRDKLSLNKLVALIGVLLAVVIIALMTVGIQGVRDFVRTLLRYFGL